MQKLKQALHNFFDWRCWSPKQRKDFVWNVIWGVLIAIALQFAPHIRYGQKMLNEAYDSLVKEDFIRAVIDRKENEPISDAIRLVIFDKMAYEASPSLGYWTPRVKLCQTVIRAIELGAKVVVVDFALTKEIPAYCTIGKAEDVNQVFLRLMREATELAKEKKSVIIMPWTERKPANGYTAQYYGLLNEMSDIIQLGSPAIFVNPTDGNVRHLRFYKKVKDETQNGIVLSLPVLAALYQWYGAEETGEIVQQTKDYINKHERLKNGITIPFDDRFKKKIRIYSQDKYSECLSARYRFRIVPREVLEKMGHGIDLLSKHKVMLTADRLLTISSDNQIWKGKTVLIGSTYSEIGDFHTTPLGRMPGVFLVANGLNLFLKEGQINQSYILGYVIVLFWVFVFAVIFIHLSAGWAAFVLTGLVLVFNTSISAYLFSKSDLFMDFWLPVTIMGIRSNISKAEGFVEKLIKKRREKK